MKDFPKYGYILIGIPLLISVYILIAPDLFSFIPIPDNISDRIGLAQLVIESAGLVAIGFAVWEFNKANSSSEIKLYISDKEKLYFSTGGFHHPVIEGTKDITTHFSLWLDNIGRKEARFIKVKLHISVIADVNIDVILHRSTNPLIEKWAKKADPPGIVYAFNGGEDFILYNRPKQVKLLHEWIEEIGHFELKLSSRSDYSLSNLSFPILYFVQTDNFAYEGSLEFTFD